MHGVAVDGGTLACTVVGPDGGAPVLLIAGGGGAMWSWGRVEARFAPEADAGTATHGAEDPAVAALEPLADGLAGLRVAAFDQAGVGRSVAVPPVESAEAYARHALAVGRSVLGDRFAVVGISLGGAAALQLALAEPAHVSALVLVASFAGVSSFVDHDLPEPPLPPDPPSWPVGVPDVEALRAEAAGVAASHGPAFPASRPALFWEIVRRSVATPTAEGLPDSQVRQFVSHDVGHRLGELAIPTAVVGGELDRTMPVGNSVLLADAIAGAELDVVDGAGHGLHLEAPDRVAAAVRATVARSRR